jgi:hypothetical protein
MTILEQKTEFFEIYLVTGKHGFEYCPFDARICPPPYCRPTQRDFVEVLMSTRVQLDFPSPFSRLDAMTLAFFDTFAWPGEGA